MELSTTKQSHSIRLTRDDSQLPTECVKPLSLLCQDEPKQTSLQTERTHPVVLIQTQSVASRCCFPSLMVQCKGSSVLAPQGNQNQLHQMLFTPTVASCVTSKLNVLLKKQGSRSTFLRYYSIIPQAHLNFQIGSVK